MDPARESRAEFTEKARPELSLEDEKKNEVFIWVKTCTKELKATKGIFKRGWAVRLWKKLEIEVNT